MSLETRVKRVNEAIMAMDARDMPPQAKEAAMLATTAVLVIGTQLTRIADALEEIASSGASMKQVFEATNAETFADLIRSKGSATVVTKHDPHDPLKDQRR
jgi:endonuclease III-like uncharacterized protein